MERAGKSTLKLSERFARGMGVGLVKWILGLLFLAGAGLYAADRLFDTTNDDIARIRATADSAIKASEAKDAVVAELRDRVVSDSGIMAGLRTQRDGLTASRDSLRTTLANAVTRVDTIRLYGKIIQIQEKVIAVCALEVETCLRARARLDSIVKVVTSDRDSLRRITGDLVEATNNCKNGQANLLLFKFCKPDPVVTFVVGVVAGGAVACWATHCFSTPTSTQVLIHTPIPPDEIPHDPPPEPRKGD